MDIIIKIELLNGCYHAQDVIVRSGDVLKVNNIVSGVDFLIAIENKDSIISNGKLISETVATGTTKVLGTVSAGPNMIKEYGIYPTSTSTSTIPGIDAPPRIIRVA